MIVKKIHDSQIGFIGETYVMLELAKHGVYSQKLYDYFDYDLQLDNGFKVEVKTAQKITYQDKRKGRKKRFFWNFLNPECKNGKKFRIRDCDFYIFVCLDGNKSPRFFIVPKQHLDYKKTPSIAITENSERESKKSLNKFEDCWNQLIK